MTNNDDCYLNDVIVSRILQTLHNGHDKYINYPPLQLTPEYTTNNDNFHIIAFANTTKNFIFCKLRVQLIRCRFYSHFEGLVISVYVVIEIIHNNMVNNKMVTDHCRYTT